MSPDGTYFLNYARFADSGAELRLVSDLSVVLTLQYNDLIDAKFDVSNNYIFASHGDTGYVSLALIADYTSSIAGAGSPGGLNPPPTEGLPVDPGGDDPPDNLDGGDSGGGGGTGEGGGGFIGDGDNFLGIPLSGPNSLGAYLPTGADGARWIIGIVIVMIVIVALYRNTQSPISIPIGAFLGVGLAIGVGMMPMWVMIGIVFLLIIMVGNLFYGGGDED